MLNQDVLIGISIIIVALSQTAEIKTNNVTKLSNIYRTNLQTTPMNGSSRYALQRLLLQSLKRNLIRCQTTTQSVIDKEFSNITSLVSEKEINMKELPNNINKTFDMEFYNDAQNQKDLRQKIHETKHNLSIKFQDKPKSLYSTESNLILPNEESSTSKVFHKQNLRIPKIFYKNMESDKENNLELELDMWKKTKSQDLHLSYIYIGRSRFPILTEESRVLGIKHTMPYSNFVTSTTTNTPNVFIKSTTIS